MLDEIKERAQAATPGPLKLNADGTYQGGFLDVVFYNHAHADIPWLVERLKRVERLTLEMGVSSAIAVQDFRDRLDRILRSEGSGEGE